MSRFNNTTTNIINNPPIKLLRGDFTFPNTDLTLDNIVSTDAHKWAEGELLLAYQTFVTGDTRSKKLGPTRLLVKPPTYTGESEYTYNPNFLETTLECCLLDTVLYPRFGGIVGDEDDTFKINIRNSDLSNIINLSATLPIGSYFNVALIDVAGYNPDWITDYLPWIDEGFNTRVESPILGLYKVSDTKYFPLLSNPYGTKWYTSTTLVEGASSIDKWYQINAVSVRKCSDRVETYLNATDSDSSYKVIPISFVDILLQTAGSSVQHLPETYRTDDFIVDDSRRIGLNVSTLRLGQDVGVNDWRPYQLLGEGEMVSSIGTLISGDTATTYTLNCTDSSSYTKLYHTEDYPANNVNINVSTVNSGESTGIHYVLIVNKKSETITVAVEYAGSFYGPSFPVEISPGCAVEFSFVGTRYNPTNTHYDVLTVTYSEELNLIEP